MLYVRGYDAPSIRQLSERTGVRLPPGATPEQRGFAAYMQHCFQCHGPERTGTNPPKQIGMDVFSRTVRNGRGEMPAFPATEVTAANLETLAAYFDNPAAGFVPPQAGRGGRGGDTPPGPSRPAGIREFNGPFGAQWLTSDGLPAIGPPWSELVAYDLNQGTIKWRVPAGTNAALAAKGITNTGSYRPRNGPVVTAGGIIFMATGADQTLHAYDKETGKVLWEKLLEGNPDGIPAVYETGARQYVVFYVAGDNGGGSRTAMNFKPGKVEAQGYYAFALPQRNPTAKKK
jgi:quinoprotein glucose dehydrogenase